MKKILLFSTLLLLSITLFAFTPVIDGIKDAGWGVTPTHSTTTLKQPTNFNLDGGCYVTDDPNFVYIGIPTDNDPWGDGMPVHFHVAIDLRNTATGGSNDAWGSQIVYGQPFKPDFDIITQWSTVDQNPGWTGLQTWTGSAWSQTQLLPAYIQGGGNKFTEIAIARSILGNIEISEIMNISVWARPAYSKPRATVCLPADATFPADWGDGGGSTFTTQFPYTLTTLLTDAIAPQIVSITQLTDSSFRITFNEPMKEENAIDTANYTLTGGMTVSSIDVVNPSTFTFHTALKLSGGTTYSVTAHPEIVDVAGNPIDDAFKTASFVALYYTNVTFQLDMNVLILNGGFVPATDQVAVRGSINGWGTTMLADPNADGIYTLTMSVPFGVGSSIEYKFWHNHLGVDNWEGVANRPFTIVAADNLIPVVYFNDIAPTNLTTHAIDVTFQVEMALETTYVGVYVAGGFNSWNGSANIMALDSGTLYTATVTYPAGSVKAQEFKFVNDTTWEYINNRPFLLDDALTVMQLPIVYFNNSIPTDLVSMSFVTMTTSTFTNFIDNETLPAGSNLQFEIVMNPVDSLANSQYSATLLYRPVGYPEWFTSPFVYNNTFGGNTYWRTTLTNGVEINDGEAVEFCINATDYNGPIIVDDNLGAYWHVNIAGLPMPTNLQISLVGDDIHLTWDAITGATSYRVYYFGDPANPSVLTYEDATTNEITLIGHALLGSRFFRVSAMQ